MFAPTLPTPHFLPYANLSTRIDCKEVDPKGKNRTAVGIYAAGAGTAVIRPIGGASDGSNDRTITLTAGKDLPLEFQSVESGTATNVIIIWSR